MRLALEIILSVNAILLFLALLCVFLMGRSSLKYRRNVGDLAVQYQWRSRILRVVVLLLFISLAGAAFNLFSI